MSTLRQVKPRLDAPVLLKIDENWIHLGPRDDAEPTCVMVEGDRMVLSSVVLNVA